MHGLDTGRHATPRFLCNVWKCAANVTANLDPSAFVLKAVSNDVPGLSVTLITLAHP